MAGIPTNRHPLLAGRLLQFNLVNSTDEPLLTPDYIRLYDGDIYNVTSRQMAQLSVGAADGTVFHVTNETSLSVQLHASGAGSRHGFIAEVVTLPVSSIGFSEWIPGGGGDCSFIRAEILDYQ